MQVQAPNGGGRAENGLVKRMNLVLKIPGLDLSAYICIYGIMVSLFGCKWVQGGTHVFLLMVPDPRGCSVPFLTGVGEVGKSFIIILVMKEMLPSYSIMTENQVAQVVDLYSRNLKQCINNRILLLGKLRKIL